MAYWEFLLQKEGDRTWLPLESPDVEILEGRYRIVARSNRVTTPVEIRIGHQVIEDNQPRHRTQKRSSRTNQDGLLVVIPFTQLQPGLWDFRCSSDLMADMLGTSWQHQVQLQVLPQEAEVGDWDLDSPDAASELVTAVIVPPADAARSPDPVSATAVSPEPASAPESAPNADAEIPVQLKIQLDQQTYAARRGHPLVITGRIDYVLQSDSLDSHRLPSTMPSSRAGAQDLLLRLIDPQSGELLAEARHLLTDRLLPYQFSCSLDLSDDCQTHLCLGQIAVYGDRVTHSPTDSSTDSPILTQQSFTVTTDLDELLQAIADESNDSVLFDSPEFTSPFAASTADTAPDLTLLELIDEAEPIAPQFRVSQQPPLPPQLHKPDPTVAKPKSLDLPSFGKVSAVPDAALAEVDPIEDDRAIAEPDPELDPEIATPGEDHQADEMAELEPAAIELDTEAAIQAFSTVPGSTEPATIGYTPEDSDFRALNLQNRFLNRLSAFATDTELANGLQALFLPTALSTSPPAQPMNMSALAIAPPLGLDDDLSAHEFVVDDEHESGARSLAERAAVKTPVPIPDTIKLPEDESVPIPVLTVLSSDLVAGQPVNIVVRLPHSPAKLSVKLWIYDRQSRDLVDDPHWLTHFAPNGHGQVEAGLQLTAPFGCLELQIEAIAVEIATQRESEKTTLSRTVSPSSFHSLAVEELDL